MPRELTRGQRAAAEKARVRADERGLRQRDLAEAVGVTEKAVWSFLNGQSWPRGRTLAGYELALGWPTEYLVRLAGQVDSAVQALHDAEPGERRVLELVQELRTELDHKQIDRWSAGVQREVQRLLDQLSGLGAEADADKNVRPLILRPADEVAADLERERALRLDTLRRGGPSAQAITKGVHDLKIRALENELEQARRHGESSVTGS